MSLVQRKGQEITYWICSLLKLQSYFCPYTSGFFFSFCDHCDYKADGCAHYLSPNKTAETEQEKQGLWIRGKIQGGPCLQVVFVYRPFNSRENGAEESAGCMRNKFKS